MNKISMSTHLNYLFNELNTNSNLNPLLQTLVEKSLEGNLCYTRSLENSINQCIKRIDQLISKQLRKIIHNPQFSKLEGAWRGLNKLVKNSETSSNLKIRVLSCNLTELQQDFYNAADLDQSQIYKKIYENEFGTPGGQPYAALVADYEFHHQESSLEVLRQLAYVAATAFCPIISAAAPTLLGLSSWNELNKRRDIAKTIDGPEYLTWNRFRESEEARFVYLSLPRSIARATYRSSDKSSHNYTFNEFETIEEASDPQNYCWMNSAYNLASLMSQAFTKYGWCINIRGSESGGRVENLPIHGFKNTAGEYQYQCPTEINITDRREAELSRIGLLPLCYYKNADYAVFFGAESLQKSHHYDQSSATENARISARLPYIMATSRFAHYLKIMTRDLIGSFMEASEISEQLNRWLLNYVNGNKDSKQELKAKYPLAEARVEVQSTPGKAGSYEAIAWLRPWLQTEELSASLRLVAKIPRHEHHE